MPLIIGFGAYLLDARGTTTSADFLLQNFLYRTHAPRTPPPVTILAIDDASLARLGSFPWDRDVYAKLLGVLREETIRPATIGFDVGFFDEPGEGTRSFARALQEFPRPITLAAKASSIAPSAAASGPLERLGRAPGSGVGPALAIGVDTGLRDLLGGTVTPGFANVIVDVDQRVRRIHAAVVQEDGHVLPSFAVALVRAYLGADDADDPLAVRGGRAVVTNETYRLLPSGASVSPIVVPLDDDGAYLINYMGGSGSIPRVSFVDALEGRVDPALLKDRIVLIGATTLDLHDIVSRPGAGVGQVPGVEVHGEAITALLSHDVLLPVDPRWTAITILLAALLAATVAWYLRTSRSILALGGILLALLIVAALAFSFSVLPGHMGRLLAIAAPVVAALGSYVAVLLLRVTLGDNERRFLREAFTQYVSPEIVREIALHPEKLTLGGERRRLTVLFSDLRGFTTLSELLDPEALVALLNEYFDIQTQLILQRSGVIDKFIGDALMAFWGAPLEEPQQAVKACGAALAMVQSLPAFNADITQRGLPPVAMGVGVNTGPAVVGNMGSSLRFDYTAMGDTVNLASRLESITKAYGVSMLVSESTRSEAEHAFLFRTIDRLKVKGKSQAVTVHEVLAPRVGDEKIPLWASQYEDALRAMTARHWDEAETLLDSVLAEKPGDGPAKLLIARISDYRLTPPPSSWDGAWAWETK